MFASTRPLVRRASTYASTILRDMETPVSATDQQVLGFADDDVAQTLRDFEAALSKCAAPSAPQIERMKAMKDEVLPAELEFTTQILQRFGDAVSAAMSNPNGARSFLCDLDLRLVTRDHSWRTVFAQLQRASESDGHLARVAMWNYLAYLCSRRTLLATVLANRKGLEETDEQGRISQQDTNVQSLERLPHGLAVTLTIPYRKQLELHLGEHVFCLIDGYPPQLQGPSGETLRLRLGEQIVGRHPSCDLTVPANYSEVSRSHMMLQWYGDSRLTVTDQSSHGTYVQARHIAVSAPGASEPQQQMEPHAVAPNRTLNLDALTLRRQITDLRDPR
jgi:hypothetical protein